MYPKNRKSGWGLTTLQLLLPEMNPVIIGLCNRSTIILKPNNFLHYSSSPQYIYLTQTIM